jgi:hypothetical protein
MITAEVFPEEPALVALEVRSAVNKNQRVSHFLCVSFRRSEFDIARIMPLCYTLRNRFSARRQTNGFVLPFQAVRRRRLMRDGRPAL